MFNIKQKTKPGQCEAMRCKAPEGNKLPGAGALCDRHAREWDAAGRPALCAIAPAAAVGSTDTPTVKISTAWAAAVDPGKIVGVAYAPKTAKPLPAPEAARAEIEPTRAGLEAALQQCAAIPLDSQAALDWLGQARTVAKRALEWLEERRTSITKPMLEAKRAVDAVFEPSKQQAQAVIQCCDTRLAAFEASRKAAQDAALAAVGGGAADEHTLVAAHGGELTLPAEVSKRRTLCVKVTDPALVPRPFLQLDESLALAYARERGQDTCKVPGLEFFYEEHIITARGVL